MQSAIQTVKRVPVYGWYAFLTLAYVMVALLAPVDKQTLHSLHLALPQYRVLIFAVIVPYTLIWFAAFTAYSRMHVYANRLDDTPEGPPMRQLARGIQVMAWGLAVPSIISTSLKSFGAVHPAFHPSAIIIANYVTLLVPLVAFTLIGNGSRRLADMVKIRMTLNMTRLVVLAFIVMAVFYTFLTLKARVLHDNPYHLTRNLTILTIIIPYLYAWFMGVIASIEISLYAYKIRGLLYKQALNLLASGIAAVVGSTIFIQFVTVVYAYKNSYSLGTILVLVYILLAIEAAGFLAISAGSRRLQRIEEI